MALAKWFANQQLNLLAKGRHAATAKVEDEVLKLLDDRSRGKRLEKEERESGQRIDYLTARTIQRAHLTSSAEAAHALLGRMEDVVGLLVGEDITPTHGGKTKWIFRAVKNPVSA